MGELLLTYESLVFTGKKISFEIPLSAITKISTGHYTWTAKPYRLDYITVKYDKNGKSETVLLEPTIYWGEVLPWKPMK